VDIAIISFWDFHVIGITLANFPAIQLAIYETEA